MQTLAGSFVPRQPERTTLPPEYDDFPTERPPEDILDRLPLRKNGLLYLLLQYYYPNGIPETVADRLPTLTPGIPLADQPGLWPDQGIRSAAETTTVGHQEDEAIAGGAGNDKIFETIPKTDQPSDDGTIRNGAGDDTIFTDAPTNQPDPEGAGPRKEDYSVSNRESDSERLTRLQEEWGIELVTAAAPPREGGNFVTQSTRIFQDAARAATGVEPSIPKNLKGEVADILEDLKRYRRMSAEEKEELQGRINGIGGAGRETYVLQNQLNVIAKDLKGLGRMYPAGLSEEEIETRLDSYEQVKNIADTIGFGGSTVGLAAGSRSMKAGSFLSLVPWFADRTEDHYSDLVDKFRRELERRRRE